MDEPERREPNAEETKDRRADRGREESSQEVQNRQRNNNARGSKKRDSRDSTARKIPGGRIREIGVGCTRSDQRTQKPVITGHEVLNMTDLSTDKFKTYGSIGNPAISGLNPSQKAVQEVLK